MINSFETPTHIHVVTDLADTDLHTFLKERKRLPEGDMQRITWDLLSALHYLHDSRIMHRDLKPQNILLDIDGHNAKLCDFGLARNLTMDTYLLHSVKGTPLYMAPEILAGKPYDQQADLWSLGCILYEILVGKPPFKGQSLPDLMLRLNNQAIIWPEQMATESCLTFLKGLLRKKPEDRLKWDQIKEHNFVKDHLIIVDVKKCTDHSLTAPLTESQNLAKEKQRDEIKYNKEKKIIAVQEKRCHLVNQKKFGPKNKAAARQLEQMLLTTDNESISSQDSVNAIIQTDIDTDVEGLRMVNAKPNNNMNLVIKRFTDNFSVSPKVKAEAENSLVNSNLVIGKMADNFNHDHIGDINNDEEPAENWENEPSTSGRCRELEKKKLANNLDNFSIRLASNSNPIESATNVESSPKAE